MFEDRIDAGRALTLKLHALSLPRSTVVIGLPRGGVVVAREISEFLSLPLSLLVVRKIGDPNNPELALGAVTREHTVVWDEELVRKSQLTHQEQEKLIEVKEKERVAREKKFAAKFPRLSGKTVIVVDDGVATGATAIAAAIYLRKKNPAVFILATPVIAQETYRLLRNYYFPIIALHIPRGFSSVGAFYRDFHEVTDQEVKNLLK